ncbi:MAG: ABC transporter substrate-binding protein [Nitrosomonadales bacterium]
MNKIIALCLGGVLMSIALATRADALDPDELIKSTAQEVLTIVKQDKDIRAGDKKKILALVDAKVLPHFDFERMTRLAVGKGWRSATPEQKKSLVTEFRNLLVRTYANAFTGYQDQTIEVKPLKIPAGADEVTVKSLINKPGAQPVAVDYEMEKSADGWKAFDLIIEGASLVTTYRGTFSDQVQQSGIDGLIKMLADKNAANNAVNKADAK